jgi:hypothetical protein
MNRASSVQPSTSNLQRNGELNVRRWMEDVGRFMGGGRCGLCALCGQTGTPGNLIQKGARREGPLTTRNARNAKRFWGRLDLRSMELNRGPEPGSGWAASTVWPRTVRFTEDVAGNGVARPQSRRRFRGSPHFRNTDAHGGHDRFNGAAFPAAPGRRDACPTLRFTRSRFSVETGCSGPMNISPIHRGSDRGHPVRFRRQPRSQRAARRRHAKRAGGPRASTASVPTPSTRTGAARAGDSRVHGE